VQVDGATAGRGPVPLDAGTHEITGPPGAPVFVVWVGPTLNAIPNLGAGALERTFVNFY
jgi:hypothetical protein